MDGALNLRQAQLLTRLKARTDRDGKPKRNFVENVAAIRAELDVLNDRIAFVERQQEEGAQRGQ